MLLTLDAIQDIINITLNSKGKVTLFNHAFTYMDPCVRCRKKKIL